MPWMPKDGFCSTCEPGTPPEDCPGGPTEEEVHCVKDMGLTKQDVEDITEAWKLSLAAVKQQILKSKGFSWQQFTTTKSPTKEQCTSFMTSMCKPGVTDTEAMYFGFNKPVPNFELDLATFLLIRGPYAWLGYGWLGCTQGHGRNMPYIRYGLPESIKLDYGVPTKHCVEDSPGVFTRDFSKSTVTLDCNTFKPTITMKKLV